MPLETRTSSSQLRAVGIGLAVLTFAVAATVLFFQSAGGGGGGQNIVLSDQSDDFSVGYASTLSKSVAKDGPLLFSDVSGRGQNRPVYLVHVGDAPTEGWGAFSARAPGAPEGCFLRWAAKAERFEQLDSEDATCGEPTFDMDGQPAAGSGAGKPLTPYPVTVDGDGDEATVVIHLGFEGRRSVPSTTVAGASGGG